MNIRTKILDSGALDVECSVCLAGLTTTVYPPEKDPSGELAHDEAMQVVDWLETHTKECADG